MIRKRSAACTPTHTTYTTHTHTQHTQHTHSHTTLSVWRPNRLLGQCLIRCRLVCGVCFLFGEKSFIRIVKKAWNVFPTTSFSYRGSKGPRCQYMYTKHDFTISDTLVQRYVHLSSPSTRLSCSAQRYMTCATMIIPPTAELGVLDDFSKPDEGIHEIKIRCHDLFGVFFACV